MGKRTGGRVFLAGEGSLLPISAADRERIIGAGILLEECTQCQGTGAGERYRDDEGTLVEQPCRGCAGRGALTDDGCTIPEALRAGELFCTVCQSSMLEHGCCAPALAVAA